MKHYLSLIVLVVILIVLGGYWSQVRSVVAVGHATKQPLLKFDPSKVVSFSIRHGRNPIVSVKRQGSNEWFVESPFPARADIYLVDRALAILRLVNIEQTIGHAKGEHHLSQFELGQDNSVIKVALETKDAHHWLELGGVSANGMMQYARSSDRQEIALIQPKSIQALPQNASEFIDRRIFPLAQETLHTIELKDTRRSMVLQAGDTGWRVESPVHARADYQVLVEWLQRLAGLNAAAAHPADPQGGNRPPGLWIGSLRMAAGKVSTTADVFHTPGKLIIHRSDQPSLRFEMSTEALTAIFHDAFGLFDKHVLQEETSNVAVVEIHQYGHSVRLIRTNTGWSLNGRLFSPDRSEAMEQWLRELHLSEGISLLSAPKRCRITPPSRSDLTLRDHENHLLGRIELARTQACGDVATLPSGLWVRLNNTALIDLIPQLDDEMD